MALVSELSASQEEQLRELFGFCCDKTEKPKKKKKPRRNEQEINDEKAPDEKAPDEPEPTLKKYMSIKGYRACFCFVLFSFFTMSLDCTTSHRT